ncbi:MAG: hypothetical protein ACFFCS_28500, partial [Candidatus Hodarchaeota archaeon]
IFLGGWTCSIVNFILFVIIFKRLGYSITRLLCVEFSRKEIKEVFSFGGKLTLGNGFYGFTSMFQMTLISLFVLNFNTELGLYNQVGNLTTNISLIFAYTGALIPAISEAHSHKKDKLVEYYIIEGIKWCYFFLFFMVAVILATGEGFLMISGSQWFGAVKYMNWYVLFCAWWPMAWFVDTIFQGTGHGGYNTIVWYIEQVTRLILLFVLLPIFQLFGLIFAYIPGIILKVISAIIIIRKKICSFKPYWVHTFLASGISAFIVYLMLEGIKMLIPWHNFVLGALLFMFGFILGLIPFGFLSGFLGGFDDNTIKEFKAGIEMVRLTRIAFNPLRKAVELGHRLSPWRNKFAVTIFDAAREEAMSLTTKKVKMDI